MKIEAGKYYRTIRGDVFGPLVEFARKEGSFFLNEEESWRLNEYPFSYDGDVWSKNGVCGTGQLKDLVAEVYVSGTPPAPQVNTTKTARDELVEKAALAILNGRYANPSPMSSYKFAEIWLAAEHFVEARKK